MKIKEIDNKAMWEGFLEQGEEKSFLHSWNWGEFQKSLGEKVWRFGIYENKELLSVAQVIKVKARRGTFLLVPHGPVLINVFPLLSNEKGEILDFLLKELKKLARQEQASFIRIAPIWERNKENIKIFRKLGFLQAPMHVHPEVTWQLKITKPEEELLMDMRKTTRYLIRQGVKNKDLEIIQDKEMKNLEIFNQIYQKTAQRHKFTPFTFEYLKKQFEYLSPTNEIALFLAQYKGELIAGAVVVFWQNWAFYHHGASLQKYSKIPASYLLQWEAIREAKKRGCKIYNFWGLVEEQHFVNKIRYKALNKKHPWAGLTYFKQGFSGFKRKYVRTQDYVLSPKYLLNYLVETIRRIKRGY